jgi:TRAP-type mannitol/chloroaromatic compound transport system permease small subunit
MQFLLAFSRRIDRLTGSIGHTVSWLIVAAVLISAANAIVRKVFDTGSNAALEVQWWLYAMVFLLAAPWTLRDNEHIRIDVVSSRLSQSARNWIDIIGHALFLLPVAGMMVWTSWAYAVKSWLQHEGSANAGGLTQWPIKMIIPIAFALLFLQGLSELIKRAEIMRGYGNGGEHDLSYHEAAAGRDQHASD